MKTVKIWDGETSINGISAEEIISSREDLRASLGDILLLENNGFIEAIQIGSNIKRFYNMPVEYTLEQVRDSYLEEIEKQEKEQITLEEQAIKIDTLEAEKEALKKISIEQDKMLFDNIAEINNIKFNLGGI